MENNMTNITSAAGTRLASIKTKMADRVYGAIKATHQFGTIDEQIKGLRSVDGLLISYSNELTEFGNDVEKCRSVLKDKFSNIDSGYKFQEFVNGLSSINTAMLVRLTAFSSSVSELHLAILMPDIVSVDEDDNHKFEFNGDYEKLFNLISDIKVENTDILKWFTKIIALLNNHLNGLIDKKFDPNDDEFNNFITLYIDACNNLLSKISILKGTVKKASSYIKIGNNNPLSQYETYRTNQIELAKDLKNMDERRADLEKARQMALANGGDPNGPNLPKNRLQQSVVDNRPDPMRFPVETREQWLKRKQELEKYPMHGSSPRFTFVSNHKKTVSPKDKIQANTVKNIINRAIAQLGLEE